MKRVLIISYKWPPSGGIGVLRNLKFVKYLRDFGWEPIVLIPTKADYPYLDENNWKDVPEGITTITCPIIEPFSMFKLLSGKKKEYVLSNPVDIKGKKQNIIDKLGIWIRGNFFIPDARSLWIRPAVRSALEYIDNNPVDAILTDGPPHTNTRIGYLIAKKTGLPWLADFQDPWSQVDYLPKYKLTKIAWKIHRKMEQQVFSRANKITSASPGFTAQLEDIGAKNVTTLYYGYDEEDFAAIELKKKTKFRITHAGLLGEDRKPETLFKILNELCTKSPFFKDDLEIYLMGNVDFSVVELLKREKLFENTVLTGSVSREVVLESISNSSVLLLLINKAYNANARIPAKIFEYIRTGNKVLALGPQKSDINDLLRKINRPGTIEYNNSKALYKFIEQSYSDFKDRNEKTNIDPNMVQLSNQAITKQLSKLLDKISIKEGESRSFQG